MFRQLVVFLAICLAAVSAFGPAGSRVVGRQVSLFIIHISLNITSIFCTHFYFQLNMLFNFKPKGSKSSTPSVKASTVKATAPATKKAAAAPAKKGTAAKKGAEAKDMTWGGRPDPTPEAYVDDSNSWLNAPWRYNRK
jgi:hypothetical protein